MASSASSQSRRRRWFANLLAAAGAAAAIIVIGLAFIFLTANWPLSREPQPNAPTFVGSETCAQCHQSEADLWRRSQHILAMAHANEGSVLADFNNTSFEYYGVHTQFFRRGRKYFVETDGPDGKLAEFEIKYTFGVDPLQQYLIEFPDGRIQALSIAWDSRPEIKAASTGFISIPKRTSTITTCCIGPS